MRSEGGKTVVEDHVIRERLLKSCFERRSFAVYGADESGCAKTGMNHPSDNAQLDEIDK